MGNSGFGGSDCFFLCSPLLHYRFANHANSCGNAIANSQGLLHAETGFSYFGARYYDSDILTGWLSVDPMADKYPNISPYAYCAWNPVKLVDPDGEEIWIFGENEKIKYSIGMSSKDLSGFSKLTVDALNSIYSSSDEGAELISSLTTSDNIFNIKQQTLNDVSKFTPVSSIRASARNNKDILAKWLTCIENGYKTSSEGEILWRSDGYNILTTEGLRNDPVYHLIHELSHAYDSNIGCMYYNDIKYNGLKLDEWSACLRANCIGSYMGFPKQTVYEGEADIHGNYIKGGTKLFDCNGNEINPF
jgi:RHS repeat-associated protein